LKESKEERDLREGWWLNSEEKTMEPRREGVGLGAREDSSSLGDILLRDTERPTFLIELNALEARDLNDDFEGLKVGSETEGGRSRSS